jgi:hypothetical protein
VPKPNDRENVSTPLNYADPHVSVHAALPAGKFNKDGKGVGEVSNVRSATVCMRPAFLNCPICICVLPPDRVMFVPSSIVHPKRFSSFSSFCRLGLMHQLGYLSTPPPPQLKLLSQLPQHHSLSLSLSLSNVLYGQLPSLAVFGFRALLSSKMSRATC